MLELRFCFGKENESENCKVKFRFGIKITIRFFFNLEMN